MCGSSDLHTISEALVAKFVGMEDALISSMAFATNSTYIPALVGKGFKHNASLDMGTVCPVFAETGSAGIFLPFHFLSEAFILAYNNSLDTVSNAVFSEVMYVQTRQGTSSWWETKIRKLALR